MKLKDKVALVTGATAPQGRGKAIAVAMANEGAKIAICDINEQGVTQTATDIDAGRDTVHWPSMRCFLGRRCAQVGWRFGIGDPGRRRLSPLGAHPGCGRR
jgi:NAD(P)-dependent dehydrogenase (short-subunit alcohol dehydrogenase family)